jgi:uncharacterized protein (DUF58 family)
MQPSIRYIKDLFIPARLYMGIGICALFFVAAFLFPPLLMPAKVLVGVLGLLTLADYIFLFRVGGAPVAKRTVAERLSNGDDNTITLRIRSRKPFAIRVSIIDELPFQFQRRHWQLHCALGPMEKKELTYTLRPTERGEYAFGHILLYMQSRLGLIERRCITGAEQTVAVYPSYLQLRRYELLSQTSIQSEQGSRRMRRIGHSMEFEQIREYVQGDDIRTLNWKAMARRSHPMVNTYSDERSQLVYCVIDRGRLMKMPFGGLSLLDYAINSTLVLSSVCLRRQDRVGLISFDSVLGDIVPADRRPLQQSLIAQRLYNQQTQFRETDFEILYQQVRTRIRQRSLLILFTNFETLNGLRRQLPTLRALAKYHLLLLVFFENTELTALTHAPVKDIEGVYRKTIAEKLAAEKRQIVKELNQQGIRTLLTPPEHLTLNAINKYLELKARQAG